jgi:hypothetical protein
VITSASKLHDEGYYSCTASNEREESHAGTIQIKVLSKFGLKLSFSLIIKSNYIYDKFLANGSTINFWQITL